jgi:hypothetical protein
MLNRHLRVMSLATLLSVVGVCHAQTPAVGLASGAGSELYTLATAGNALGLLSNYTGPLGPQAASWNVSNEGVAGTSQIISARSGLVLDGGANQHFQ